jgi:hypothetical protein
MRMQKEEKIVLVLLFMALGSLAVAYWAFSPDEGGAASKEDSSLSLEGVVLEMNPTKTGGHLIMKLDSTAMPVFVPRDSGAEDIQNKVNAGDRISVHGTVAEFGGREELKVGNAGDIAVLRS